MKKARVISVLFGVLLVAGVSISVRFATSTANAASEILARPVLVCGGAYADIPTAPDENCFSTCGGEIPWPFQLSNQTVELADGDKYVLMGRVVIKNGSPRFVVDLERHPWLANSQRKVDSSYPLVGSVEYWKRYEDKLLQLRAQARWVPNTSGQAPYVDVTLSSLADPAVMREGHTDEFKAGSR
ncbi:hypothetical protein EBZ37_06590 [bacterium]|nr:hypothetical protein [bacterium]